MTTVAEVLLRRRDDDNVGLIYIDGTGGETPTWTWREVVHECAVRAAVLRSLRRDGPFHVGVLLENVPDFVFLLGAAALEGATIVGINPTRRGEGLAGDIRHTDCQLLVTDRTHAPLLDGFDLGLDADRPPTVDGIPPAQADTRQPPPTESAPPAQADTQQPPAAEGAPPTQADTRQVPATEGAPRTQADTRQPPATEGAARTQANTRQPPAAEGALRGQGDYGWVFVVEDSGWAEILGEHRGAGVPGQLPREEELWVLVFTSGSSGVPKAVRATQGRMGGMTDMGFTADDVLYCAMPLFHSNALVANLLPGIGAGATIVLRRRFSASGFLPDARRHGVTFVNSVGRALSYILATPPTPQDKEHKVRIALAPESSRRDIAEFQDRFGCFVLEGYGSSEGAIRLLPVPTAPPGALGRADPGVDLAVVDPETGEERPRAQFDDAGRLLNGEEAIGELVRRDAGAATFEGYYNNPEADRERTRNGWFWSGDLAYRDEQDIFHFAGRSIDWLRVDGENFAAAPVERIIGRYPAVRLAAVYAVPDPRTGDRVMAAVELREGAAFDPEDFAAFLADQPDLGTKWWPRFVRVAAALPDTATNKVAKQQLRATGWRTDDPVWWQPEPRTPYEPLTPEAVAAIAADLAAHRGLH